MKDKVLFYRMFSLSICLTLLTLSLTGEASTVEYWVRPDTVLECPQDTPQHQCVTVTDLISYSTNSSLNQGRNITIHFLPGVHTPRVGGRILIENENWNTTNLTATLTGEWNGGRDATIVCSWPDKRIALVFYNIVISVLTNIQIINCGYKTGFRLSVSDITTLNFFVPDANFTTFPYNEAASVAIIIEAPTQNTVVMSNLAINKSTSFGVLVVHYSSGSDHDMSFLSLNIGNSIIASSNAHQPGEVFNSFGSNLFIVTKTRLLHIFAEDFNVFYGCEGLILSKPSMKSIICGGVNIYSRNSLVSLSFHHTVFNGNEALVGGGLNIILMKTEPSIHHNKTALISNSIFSGNKAILGGGVSIYDIDSLISVNIISSVFFEQIAGSGGAIYISDTSTSFDENTFNFQFNKCSFIRNGATIEGTALFLNSNFGSALVQNCWFSSNFGKTSSTSESVIYLDSLPHVNLDNILIIDNESRGLYVKKTLLIINRNVVISNNYASESNGGGIYVDCVEGLSVHSMLILEYGSKLHILNNRADKKGGGIFFSKRCSREYGNCPVNAPPLLPIVMVNNTAKVAGNSIYGGDFDNCLARTFWKIFNITENNSYLAISSLPQKACLCTSNFERHFCETNHSISIFFGQIFDASLICVGQLGYPSSCVIRAEVTTLGAEIAPLSKLKDVGLKCRNFSFLIKVQSNVISKAALTLFPDIRDYSSGSPGFVTIHVSIEDCPLGFKTVLDNDYLVCTCSDKLHKEGIVCNINELTLYKTSPMWVGNYSGDIAVHRNCPFGYCKTNFTAVNIFNQQDQCDWKRSGVLCGACRPGLSLVLGTSQCKQCSNLRLLLLIPFALAGVILVLLLLKCNLTVSMGTINGLIFYANIVQATKTAFFPTGSNSTFTHILSVFIAWLNLDLGIETCFAKGLNTYQRTWLQFVFPVYIWSLVGVMIVVSRYSIRVSRWTGSNTVSVLATLFLLSYAKLLRVTFDVFTSTSLIDDNGTTTLLWLLDGDYVFLQWPHSLLFTTALVTLLGHIVPFTALLLVSPTLQRYSHHKPLRWVNRLKPLLDAYQGPYKNKVRYWTGLLLLVRLIILSANAINVTGNQAVSLFTTTVVVTILVLYLWVMVGNKLYRNRIPYFLEVFFIGNLQLYSLASLFLSSDKEVRSNAQEHLTYCMVCSALVVFMLIVVYHCYKLCLNTRQGKKAHHKLVSLVKKPEADLEEHPSADLAGPKHSSTPTTTVVELKEPLLVDDTQ